MDFETCFFWSYSKEHAFSPYLPKFSFLSIVPLSYAHIYMHIICISLGGKGPWAGADGGGQGWTGQLLGMVSDGGGFIEKTKN